jgi:cytochrome c551/c552
VRIITYIAIAVLGFTFLALVLFRQNEDVERQAVSMTGGNPREGRALIGQYGCGSCHSIPGVRGANALVGPPLNRIANRTYIAGVLVNKPYNLIRWLKDPPGVDPLTAMPNLHIADDEAKSIAAYLYTLR